MSLVEISRRPRNLHFRLVDDRSGVKPNFVFSALSGADAPNVCITICEPRRPT